MPRDHHEKIFTCLTFHYWGIVITDERDVASCKGILHDNEAGYLVPFTRFGCADVGNLT